MKSASGGSRRGEWACLLLVALLACPHAHSTSSLPRGGGDAGGSIYDKLPQHQQHDDDDDYNEQDFEQAHEQFEQQRALAPEGSIPHPVSCQPAPPLVPGLTPQTFASKPQPARDMALYFVVPQVFSSFAEFLASSATPAPFFSSAAQRQAVQQYVNSGLYNSVFIHVFTNKAIDYMARAAIATPLRDGSKQAWACRVYTELMQLQALLRITKQQSTTPPLALHPQDIGLLLTILRPDYLPRSALTAGQVPVLPPQQPSTNPNGNNGGRPSTPPSSSNHPYQLPHSNGYHVVAGRPNGGGQAAHHAVVGMVNAPQIPSHLLQSPPTPSYAHHQGFNWAVLQKK